MNPVMFSQFGPDRMPEGPDVKSHSPSASIEQDGPNALGKPPLQMRDFYFKTRFGVADSLAAFPNQFAIITGYATTGEQWSDGENLAADEALRRELEAACGRVLRITGYSPETLHREPGWLAALPWQIACEVGVRFRQDAIYYVFGDGLWVTHCDERRRLHTVGKFRERIDPPATPSAGR